jgi:hypothetical protein
LLFACFFIWLSTSWCILLAICLPLHMTLHLLVRFATYLFVFAYDSSYLFAFTCDSPPSGTFC